MNNKKKRFFGQSGHKDMWKDKRDKKKMKTNEQGETGNYELNNYQIGSK